MPSEGLTFSLCVSEGEVELHSSFHLPNPNSALYDQRCEARVENDVMCNDVFIPPDAHYTNIQVYASLEGLGELTNHYMLQALVGDQTVSGGDIYGIYILSFLFSIPLIIANVPGYFWPASSSHLTMYS